MEILDLEDAHFVEEKIMLYYKWIPLDMIKLMKTLRKKIPNNLKTISNKKKNKILSNPILDLNRASKISQANIRKKNLSTILIM